MRAQRIELYTNGLKGQGHLNPIAQFHQIYFNSYIQPIVPLDDCHLKYQGASFVLA
jgi:hypothetical protein